MKWLHHAIAHHFPGIEFEVLPTPDEKLGDYSTNVAFAFAKKEKKNPFEVAQEIASKFEGSEFFDKVEAVKPGFVNFYLKKEFLQDQLTKIHEHRDHFGERDLGQGKTVIVEYASTNIAKPMHVGHSRTVFIGDALARVFEILGYKVVRWDYTGDWGTHFGKILVAFRLWGNKEKLQEKPIETMLDLYVRFSAEAKENPELDEQAREAFRKLEEGDQENWEIFQWLREESLKECRAMYQLLGLAPFDVSIGESFYQKELKPIVQELLENNVAKESEGAIIVPLDEFNLPPALLQKSDGASLYLTRDLANLRYRLANFSPAKILYVVGNEQALHFEQLFAIAKILGLTSAELNHVKYGLVLNEHKKKFATREGQLILLEDVVREGTERAQKIVEEKNSDASAEEKKSIAHTVILGALKYNDLKQHPHSDITFDWDAMLDFSGNSGPYIQYTYARLMNILAKAEGHAEGDASLLNESEERRIMKHLMEFPASIEKCAELSTLNALALYLYELANDTNRFYEAIRILDDENTARRNARLMLIETIAAVLKRGLNILGIQTLSRI